MLSRHFTIVGEEDQAKRIEELTRKVEELEEAVRLVARPYSELAEQLDRFQGTVRSYFRLLDLYQKHGAISIEVILPEVKDPISKDIMRLLTEKSGLNISEITDELKARRGTSSRRIVRDRLEELSKLGLVVEKQTKGERTYEIAEHVLRKWSEVLGLTK
jgi:DNA-binding transcriptional ArsR family regulator